jgi:hypothetical protein
VERKKVNSELILDSVPQCGWITPAQMADRKDLPLKNVQAAMNLLWAQGKIYRRKSCEGHGYQFRKESVFYRESGTTSAQVHPDRKRTILG